MDEREWLAARFEEHRTHLRVVAVRILGSPAEADDAVQDTWLRLSRSDASAIENLHAWLATAVARVCLNMLQARRSRQEEPFGDSQPEPTERVVFDFTIVDGKIREISLIADPERIATLALIYLDD